MSAVGAGAEGGSPPSSSPAWLLLQYTVHYLLAIASWLSAGLGLRRIGWRYPFCGGALVALGMQEVVDVTVSVLAPPSPLSE